MIPSPRQLFATMCENLTVPLDYRFDVAGAEMVFT